MTVNEKDKQDAVKNPGKKIFRTEAGWVNEDDLRKKQTLPKAEIDPSERKTIPPIGK